MKYGGGRQKVTTAVEDRWSSRHDEAGLKLQPTFVMTFVVLLGSMTPRRQSVEGYTKVIFDQGDHVYRFHWLAITGSLNEQESTLSQTENWRHVPLTDESRVCLDYNKPDRVWRRPGNRVYAKIMLSMTFMVAGQFMVWVASAGTGGLT